MWEGTFDTLASARIWNSFFFGYDIHAPSIYEANTEEQRLGLSDQWQFKVSDAEGYAGKYDVITFFDCLHDMGDPLGSACYVHLKLTSDG